MMPTPPDASWDGGMAEAPSATEPRLAAPQEQLALFAPEDLAPAAPRKRLPRSLKALIDAIDAPTRKTRRRQDAQAAPAMWLDSFFDEAAKA